LVGAVSPDGNGWVDMTVKKHATAGAFVFCRFDLLSIRGCAGT
jgi:hypothetical protein